eukprot:374990_1
MMQQEMVMMKRCRIASIITMIKPFWTPNYKPSSSSTAITNSSTVTCTKQTQSQLQLLQSLFLENEHQIPPIKTYSIQRPSSIHDRDGDTTKTRHNIMKRLKPVPSTLRRFKDESVFTARKV